MPVNFMLPRKFGRLLFGVWLILMAFTDEQAIPFRLHFTGLNVILGILIIVAGVFIILDR